ncbi:MAG TPA: PQQ-binding-like beta-propeller repeat protein [Kofleriaceae bacterium]|nr:PQQ-binding-like beta-propeller repeat protein [Kofleriaceae bacterium]
MRAVSVTCPNCGASLDAGTDAPSITCSYCGTTARVQTRSRVWQVPAPLPAAPHAAALPVARQKVSALVVLPLLAVVVAIVLPIVVIAGKAGHVFGPDRNRMGWWGTVPVLVDVDGDRTDDVVGFSRYVLDGDRMHLAAFSGLTGKKLWETPKLGTYTEVYQGVVAVAGDVVVLATQTGELRGFDRRTGAARWVAQLGEKVDAMCAGDASAIVIGTADRRWHRVALADGARTDAPPLRTRSDDDDDGDPLGHLRGGGGGEREEGRCDPLPSSARDGMPGLVTVGSWNLPAAPGMRVERMARRAAGGPTIAIGARQPGSPVPMLAARADDGSLRWKAVVPATDPLNSRADDKLVTISDDAVFATYEPGGSDDAPHLTAFALADGRRLWDVRVAKGTTIVMTSLAVVGPNVVLSSWGHLQAFDRATGAPRFRLGEL